MISQEYRPNILQHWLESWHKASESDHKLPSQLTRRYHKDGWGFIQARYIKDSLIHFEKKKNLYPIDQLSSNSLSDFFNLNCRIPFDRMILLGHSRKATKGMPITMDQVHPFDSSLNHYNHARLILAHNGEISRDIVNGLLQNRIEDLENYSDSQLLLFYLSENINSEISSDTWFSDQISYLIKQLVKAHLDNYKKYSLQLIIQLIGNKTSHILIISVLSDYYTSQQELIEYFQIFEGNNNSEKVFCSSTISENFLKMQGSTNQEWNFKPLENNTIVELRFTEDNLLEIRRDLI